MQPPICTSCLKDLCSVATSKINLDQPLQPLDADSLKISEYPLPFAPRVRF